MSNRCRASRVRLTAAALPLSLLLAALPGCGGDSTGTERVASVVITGAPTTTFLVGDSVHLAATAVNATGGAVNNPRVSWESSVPSVAAVRGDGTLLALGAGSTVITAKVGEGKGTAAIDVSDGGTIGTQGGTLTAAGGKVQLVLPAGTLSQSTLLLVRPAASAPADSRLVPGASWELAPQGVSFYRYATLTLVYDAVRVPSGLPGASLQLYSQSGTTWAVVPGSKVDEAKGTVSGAITGTGTYAVRSTPVDRIVIRGATVGGGLYTGQTVQLSVTLYAAWGDSLPARPVTWSSSDASRLSVDAGGKVTALGTGSATITASTDGKSATTTLTVLNRPVADWSRAGDWTTYQGNPLHTGYVDATLDPVVFKQAWSATVQSGVPLNPVTGADGKVFVSTTAYFGKQLLFVLDATTGGTIWSKDFGGIHSVDPPAYADGSVYVQTGGHEDSYIWAFDAGTGQLRFRARYENQWSRYFAPVVIGQSVYMAGGYYGGMYAFSTIDGAQRWFRGLNQYDMFTPAVSGGRVYAYTGDYSPKLTVADAASGSVLYEIADPSFSWNGWSMNAAPVLGAANDLLATQGGRLLSFDLAGRAIGYQVAGSFYGDVTLANGVMYVFNNKALEARRESDGSLLWSWAPPSGQPTQTSIATANLLFVTTGSATYALDLATHGPVWSVAAGGPLALTRQGLLLIAGSDGKVTAIAVK